jgi:hypothetical protein
VCYDFKERRIAPTHYAIRTNGNRPNGVHLKSWLVETSADGENWREVASEEDNERLNGPSFTGTFAVAGDRECRFIRVVNISRNHFGQDSIAIRERLRQPKEQVLTSSCIASRFPWIVSKPVPIRCRSPQ